MGGQGAGKSYIGAYDLIRRVRGGRLYVVTAPTKTVLHDCTCRSFTEVARYCGVLLRPIGGDGFSATLRPFAGGGAAEVLFRSTHNPQWLRGPNLSGVMMDEASLSPYEAYQILTARLREAGEHGWLTITATPKGRSHWTFAEVFGAEPPRADVHLTTAATRDNPFLAPAFVQSVESNYAGLLALQELGGQFVSVEGAEWPAEYFDWPGIWFDDWPHPHSLLCRAAALDPSKGRDSKSGDYAAFVLLAVDAEGTLWVEADLVRGVGAEVLAEQAVEHQRRFQADAFAIETNQFQQLLCVLVDLAARKAGVLMPVVEVDNRVNKLVRIRRVGPYLATRRVRFRNTPGTRRLVDQLREFPEGPNDDGPDALEMALRTAGELLAGVDSGDETTVLRS